MFLCSPIPCMVSLYSSLAPSNCPSPAHLWSVRITPRWLCNEKTACRQAVVEFGSNVKLSQRLRIAAQRRVLTLSKEAELEAGVIREKLQELGFEDIDIKRLPQQSLPRCWQKIQFLILEGFSPEQVRILMGDLSRPTVIQAISFTKLTSSLRFFKTLNITGQRVVNICMWYPRVFASNEFSLKSRIEFLENLGVERHRLNALLVRDTNILSGNIDTMQMNVGVLQDLGIERDQICKLLVKNPVLLSRNVERNVMPKLAFFEDFFESEGVSRDFFRKLLIRRPEVLSLSIEGLSTKMDLLQQLGFQKNSKELLIALFDLAVTSCNVIQAKFSFLVSLGFTGDQASRLVRRVPHVLGRSEETLSRKVNYLVDVLNRDLEDIVKFPVFLLCSLEKRIVPRFEALADRKSKGMLKADYSLSHILTCRDDVFQKRFMNDPREREAKKL